MSIGLAPLLSAGSAAAERTRVMVVDDAAIVRSLIGRWVDAEPDLQIVGLLRGAPDAIEQVQHQNPDVLILDVNMPEMDGIAALPRLLQKKRDLVVLMVSTLTRRNAEISLRALALGATDYIAKPQSDGELMGCEAFRRELIDKIRTLGLRRRRGRSPGQQSLGTAELHLDAPGIAPGAVDGVGIAVRAFPPVPPRVLLIGASTGGPQALNGIVAAIGPVIDHVPVLITQHMPATFTTILAEHLARASGRAAAEARDGELIRAGRIYVAPGGVHMCVGRHAGEPVIALDDGPPANFCKPAVDRMFVSAAAVWGSWCLGVVLTGMGSDGLRGAASLAAVGAGIIAQDEATSVVWGMPGRVAQAGLACAVLPLDQIASKIVRLFRGGRR
jgi:two-component system, chemotaxis family, protein-glutamate methylesterase/glutaminase